MFLDRRIFTLSSVLFIASCANQASPQPPLTSPTPLMEKANDMTSTAKGTFQVKLNPQALHDTQADAGLARMSIDKQFTGDLQASSKGEMLSASTAVKGSAGYVAIERVTGTLNNRKGSFVLQHTGTMNRGAPSLNVSVVPDSGTEELQGLSGTMNIIITPGVHSYEFQYTLTTSP